MIRRLLCVVALSGCAGNVWRADSRFTPEERGDIDRAAEMWRDVGQEIWIAHGCFVNGFERGGRNIVRADNRSARVFSAPLENPRTTAEYINAPLKELIVIVPERAISEPLWYVVAHEFGHSLGLKHVADETAIMYPSNSALGKLCITKADIEEMCRTAGCPGEVPRGCDE